MFCIFFLSRGRACILEPRKAVFGFADVEVEVGGKRDIVFSVQSPERCICDMFFGFDGLDSYRLFSNLEVSTVGSSYFLVHRSNGLVGSRSVWRRVSGSDLLRRHLSVPQQSLYCIFEASIAVWGGCDSGFVLHLFCSEEGRVY